VAVDARLELDTIGPLLAESRHLRQPEPTSAFDPPQKASDSELSVFLMILCGTSTVYSCNTLKKCNFFFVGPEFVFYFLPMPQFHLVFTVLGRLFKTSFKSDGVLMTKKIELAAALALMLVSAQSSASLLGDTFSAELLELGSNLGGPNEHVVGAGPEGNWFSQIQYDLSASSITVNSISTLVDAEWVGGLAFSFFDLDNFANPLSTITGVSVVGGSGGGWSLIDDTDVSFTANSVLIDASEIGGVSVALDQSVTVSLTFRDGSSAPVPAPATFALMGLGLASLGWKHRKS
jgi:hypothetical protein